MQRLEPLHEVEGDAGAVYRALRWLESHGLVRSDWQPSESGPARRTYLLTPRGAAYLQEHAEILEATHDTLHRFRQRYQRLPEAGRISPPSGPNGLPGTRGRA